MGRWANGCGSTGSSAVATGAWNQATQRKQPQRAFRQWVACSTCRGSWVYADLGVERCRTCSAPFPDCWPALRSSGQAAGTSTAGSELESILQQLGGAASDELNVLVQAALEKKKEGAQS